MVDSVEFEGLVCGEGDDLESRGEAQDGFPDLRRGHVRDVDIVVKTYKIQEL